MGTSRVGPHATREYLAQMRARYELTLPAAKEPLLDEVCTVTGYHRSKLSENCSQRRI